MTYSDAIVREVIFLRMENIEILWKYNKIIGTNSDLFLQVHNYMSKNKPEECRWFLCFVPQQIKGLLVSETFPLNSVHCVSRLLSLSLGKMLISTRRCQTEALIIFWQLKPRCRFGSFESIIFNSVFCFIGRSPDLTFSNRIVKNKLLILAFRQ